MSSKKRLKITFNSPVVLWFTIICLAAFLAGIIKRDASTSLLFCVYRSSLSDPFTYVRFFGHVFGHADWSHLIGNMTMLLVVGPLLEEKHGAKPLVLVMAVTAFVTGLVHFIFFPNSSLLGASGIVFAFILLASVTQIRRGEIPLTLILVAVLYLGQQVIEGIFINDNVSNLTHIIGGCIGAGAGMFFLKKKS